ncbi:MAG TPA: hypothetical protein VGF39_04010 [Stellaceae bacterium]|jgi:hypothetical protein
MNHYLLTLVLGPTSHPRSYLHTYLMCAEDEDRQVAAVSEKMLDVAEEHGGCLLPLILATKLSSGSSLVRKILCERNEEARRLMAVAKDYHLAMFTMTDDDPDNAKLMALH